jgi:DNA-directed RNA polymerase beta' subunit
MTHVIKLHHTAEGKGSQRSTGSYTQDGVPATGGKQGAKTLGNLVLSAIVSHDALDVLKDMKLIKGQQNDDFWRDFKMGKSPTMPSTPIVYDKFLAHLQGAGINLHKEGDTTNIFGMTDSDARKLTGNHKVTSSNTYNAKDLKPISGGLFDPDIFGQDGANWGYLELPFAIPNPVMEDTVKHILGLTGKQYREALAGKYAVRGETGPATLMKALGKVNVSGEMADAAQAIKQGTKSSRDKAIKRYRALYALSKHEVNPQDFMLSRIPVLPPKFRPVTAGGDLTMVADANYLYKNIMDDINDYNEAAEAKLPADILGTQRDKIYDSFKLLTGLTSPEHGKLKEKNVGGLLKWVFGKGSPKHGGFQRRVISSAMDMSGRSVVTPNSSLKLNEIGMPETQAWDLYEPFIIKNLVSNGYPASDAVKLVSKRSPVAYDVLKKVVTERPIIMTRAPALHKYSVMGVWPKLTKGHTLQVPAALTYPFNMDYDGDTASYYVPMSDDAVKETIEKMMPEKNLLSARKFKAHYLPEEEYQLGMYLMSKTKNKKPTRKFKTQREAVQAYKQGLISIDEPVVIG